MEQQYITRTAAPAVLVFSRTYRWPVRPASDGALVHLTSAGTVSVRMAAYWLGYPPNSAKVTSETQM